MAEDSRRRLGADRASTTSLNYVRSSRRLAARGGVLVRSRARGTLPYCVLATNGEPSIWPRTYLRSAVLAGGDRGHKRGGGGRAPDVVRFHGGDQQVARGQRRLAEAAHGAGAGVGHRPAVVEDHRMVRD